MTDLWRFPGFGSTLITCQVYLPKSDTYLYRRVIRAVLVKVEDE